jgi:hypothetical protein
LTKSLHLVSFDIPWPANYGGVIDVYHKARWLKHSGWNVKLHCFEYGRKPSAHLLEVADEVHYYPRHLNIRRVLGRLPFIVSSRDHKEVLHHLQADHLPVLLEGLHCTYFLPELSIESERRIIVRAHNIEHDYYQLLSQVERKKFHRYYLRQEADKLQRYEEVVRNAGWIAAISEKDQAYFKAHYGHSFLLRPFHAFDKVDIRKGKGDYCLYHGNLAVAENHTIARWLIEDVQPLCNARFIIAGQKPSRDLIRLAKANPKVELVVDPNFETLDKLVSEAQIHVLPASQESGTKLKLLHSLFRGRFIIGNRKMINDSALDGYCIIAESANEFAAEIDKYFSINFTDSDIRQRELMLDEVFSNSKQMALLEEKLLA